MRIKVSWMLFLFALQAVSCTVAEPADEYTGGTFVPAVTADGKYPDLTVRYSFTFELENESAPQSQSQRDTLELMKANADGIIGSRIHAYLLKHVAEMTLADLSSIIDKEPSSGNQVTQDLRDLLSDTAGLENVEIQTITVSYE